jgi:hypothetical protein
MNGFAASGRVQRTAPRLIRAGDVERGIAATPQSADVTELVDIRDPGPLSDRWAAFRDRWSELTFYLFDAQSWR